MGSANFSKNQLKKNDNKKNHSDIWNFRIAGAYMRLKILGKRFDFVRFHKND